MSIEQLAETAQAMVAPGKGIIAIDESTTTIAKRFQGTAKGAAVALSMIERIRSRYSSLGYRHAELSWILEDNDAMLGFFREAGMQPTMRWRMYEGPTSA